jgi:hypothetical protein
MLIPLPEGGGELFSSVSSSDLSNFILRLLWSKTTTISSSFMRRKKTEVVEDLDAVGGQSVLLLH